MSKILPPARPKITREEVLAKLAHLPLDFAKYPIIAFGIRGYYLNSMGEEGKNDRSLFDDAFGLITPTEFIVLNGNTDPTGTETGRACLQPGFWPMWRLDLHKGEYRAFCQRLGPCIVKRDNTEHFSKGTIHSKYGKCLGDGLWEGEFGINGHRAPQHSTGSLGCQTTPEPQWTEIITLAEKEARRLWGVKWKEKCIPYALTNA